MIKKAAPRAFHSWRTGDNAQNAKKVRSLPEKDFRGPACVAGGGVGARYLDRPQSLVRLRARPAPKLH